MNEKKQVDKTKEIHTKIPVPRLLKLVTGEQVIAGIYVQENSDFIRLNEPYKIDLYADPVDESHYFMEERMSLKPWVFQAEDKIFSIHKSNILTLAVPNEHITVYYNNVRLNYTKKLEPLIEKKLRESSKESSFNKLLTNMDDDDYFETLEYLKGNRKKH